MYGVSAEVFEEEIVPYIPKILQLLTKQIKEDATGKLHSAVSETIGNLVHHALSCIDNLKLKVDIFENQFLFFVNQNLDKQLNKSIQQGTILCLTKIVINCEKEVLQECIN